MNEAGLELMKRCVDGDATESEREDFVRMLDEDDSLLDAYCEEIRICSALEWHFSIESDLKASVRRRADLVTEMRRRQQKQARWIGLAAAATVMLLVAFYGAYRMIESRPSASFVANELASWTIRHADGTTSTELELKGGERVELERGAIDLDLQDGVRAILEAPAALTLLDHGLVSLKSGRLSVEVSDQAGQGFTVETPGFRATDLGTRFTVDVPADGRAEEIHVTEGLVQVTASARSAPMLRTGQALRLLPDGLLARIPYDPDHFRASLADLRPRHIRWTFDAVETGGFPATGSLGEPGKFSAALRSTFGTAPEPTLVEGLSGMALVLHGEGDFADTGWPAIPADAPFTIAVWFRVSADQKNPEKDDSQSFPRRNLLSWGDFHPEARDRGLALDFPKLENGSVACATVLGSPAEAHVARADPFDGRWHHFVSISQGRSGPDSEPKISHFLDGRRLETAESDLPWIGNHWDPADGDLPSFPLRFGIAAIHAPGLPTFAVTLDDVRVFDAPLGERNVIALYREKPLPTNSP